MSTNAVNSALNVFDLQSLGGQNYASGSANTSGEDFSSVLNSMLGAQDSTGGAAADAYASAGAGLNYNSLISAAAGELRLQNAQTDAIKQTLQSLAVQKGIEVNDPQLAQLVEMLKGLFAANGGQEGEMLAILEKLQQRLRQMMEESGASLAGQEAMAAVQQILPMIADEAKAKEMSQSVEAYGGEGALAMMLNQSPQELLKGMAGQAETLQAQEPQKPVEQSQESPKTQAQVFLQEAAKTSPAQETFAQVAKDFGQEGQGQTVPIEQEDFVESVTVQGQKTGEESFAQMLETGKAQGSFESAVREVKAQMASADENTKKPEAEETPKQIDAANLAPTPQTQGTEPAAKEAELPAQPVHIQLEEAITKGLQNGSQELVLTLNPRELGEVTIQMQRTAAGNFILNIVAKNPETQRILSGEMAQLQDALRAVNTEIESITTAEKFAMADTQQQFGGQHHRTWKEMHGAAYYGDEKLALSAAQNQSVAAQSLPKAALDAYI